MVKDVQANGGVNSEFTQEARNLLKSFTRLTKKLSRGEQQIRGSNYTVMRSLRRALKQQSGQGTMSEARNDKKAMDFLQRLYQEVVNSEDSRYASLKDALLDVCKDKKWLKEIVGYLAEEQRQCAPLEAAAGDDQSAGGIGQSAGGMAGDDQYTAAKEVTTKTIKDVKGNITGTEETVTDAKGVTTKTIKDVKGNITSTEETVTKANGDIVTIFYIFENEDRMVTAVRTITVDGVSKTTYDEHTITIHPDGRTVTEYHGCRDICESTYYPDEDKTVYEYNERYNGLVKHEYNDGPTVSERNGNIEIAFRTGDNKSYKFETDSWTMGENQVAITFEDADGDSTIVTLEYSEFFDEETSGEMRTSVTTTVTHPDGVTTDLWARTSDWSYSSTKEKYDYMNFEQGNVFTMGDDGNLSIKNENHKATATVHTNGINGWYNIEREDGSSMMYKNGSWTFTLTETPGVNPHVWIGHEWIKQKKNGGIEVETREYGGRSKLDTERITFFDNVQSVTYNSSRVSDAMDYARRYNKDSRWWNINDKYTIQHKDGSITELHSDGTTRSLYNNGCEITRSLEMRWIIYEVETTTARCGGDTIPVDDWSGKTLTAQNHADGSVEIMEQDDGNVTFTNTIYYEDGSKITTSGSPYWDTEDKIVFKAPTGDTLTLEAETLSTFQADGITEQVQGDLYISADGEIWHGEEIWGTLNGTCEEGQEAITLLEGWDFCKVLPEPLFFW